MFKRSRLTRLALSAVILALAASSAARAADPVGGGAIGQTWDTEILSNGLRVIYAPMPNSPVTHVRVAYHVGSRDERPDRQGFAHMFEHMMFRGSEHVAPQEHMRLISNVGGISNAFTSFDKTVYWETIPASSTEMALWLEADRMSSFKVSAPIFYTERLVVGEEWRMRMNQPYGTMYDELLPVMYKLHPYQWTPIGKMEHLQAATASELQDFFNHYYVPNNAILIIAGNIDLSKTKDQVHRYFGWIPGSDGKQSANPATAPAGGPANNGGNMMWPDLTRSIPAEPPQTEPRRLETTMRVPLPRIVMGFHLPRERSDDLEPLELLLAIVGDGRSSRLYRALVTTDDPLCVSAGAIEQPLEDGGIMGLVGTVLKGKDPAEVEKVMRAEIQKVCDNPVSAEELEKVKQQERLALAERFDTAYKTAEQLADEMLIYNSLDRVPTARTRLEAYTAADLQRVAKKYFDLNASTTMIIRPPGPPAATAPAANAPARAASNPAPATRPAAAQPAPAPGAASAPAPNAKVVKFPADYPTKPPVSAKLPAATFNKGVESTFTKPGFGPVRVIVMEDHRIPLVNFSLTLRSGGYLEPVGKEGVASLTASMIRRGPKGKTYDQFNDELDSRAISLDVSDEGDVTVIDGTALKEQFAFAFNAAKEMLLTPAMDSAEFGRLKTQSVSSIRLSLDDPHTLATRELDHDMYGDQSPLGRLTTVQTVSGLTLADVQTYHDHVYRFENAILMISGDITPADGQAAAENFLTGFPGGAAPKAVIPQAPAPAARHILLVDRPQSTGVAIRLGLPSYSIESDEKFAGSLAGQMLSSGIDSRLGRYVRAEKGYVYGVVAYFRPNRQFGAFVGETDTRFPTTADTITAMFKVFDEMNAANVPEKELTESQSRVAGQLLMSMEKTSDQAQRRIDGILNGYPIDYYDKYAERIGHVTAAEINAVTRKYIDKDKMTIVVVGPAETLKAQLEAVAPVRVVEVPAE